MNSRVVLSRPVCSLTVDASPRCWYDLQETDTMQMTIEEVITESLEADNLQLQNMSTSKYVQVMLSRQGSSSTV